MDLFPISTLIADSALRLGGSDISWHKAIFCPYVRDDGSPCYDESRGSAWIECPICGGEGVVYASPVFVKGIYTDKSDEFVPDGSGGFIRNVRTLSLPRHLDIKLLKPRSDNTSTRRFLRDKFLLLGRCCNPDGSREIIETLYLDDDVINPVINSGYIYQIVRVTNNI
jgi:hypothetical protein